MDYKMERLSITADQKDLTLQTSIQRMASPIDIKPSIEDHDYVLQLPEERIQNLVMPKSIKTEDEDLWTKPNITFATSSMHHGDLETEKDVVMGDTFEYQAQKELTPQDLFKMMQKEKTQFAGAKHWASEEERLFEILFLRNYLPILPKHWEVDFQGVTLPEHIFWTSGDTPPIVYAHSSKHEFRATNALMKLIDLSSEVATLIQSSVREKVPDTILKALKSYIVWAAQDGGYDRLEIVPNITVENIPLSIGDDAFKYVNKRMKQFAELHRDFLAVDRREHGWTGVANELADRGFTVAGSPSGYSTAGIPRDGSRAPLSDIDAADELFDALSVTKLTPQEKLARSIKRSKSQSLSPSERRFMTPQRTPKRRGSPLSRRAAAKRRKFMYAVSVSKPDDLCATPPRKIAQFTRPPPVVYALFIIGHDVILASIDAAKQDETAQMSWHVSIEFNNVSQCIWNGLTVALAVCLARDEMMSRLEDFEPREKEMESDPDI